MIAEPPVPCDMTTSGYFRYRSDSVASGATSTGTKICSAAGAPKIVSRRVAASTGYQIAVWSGRGPVRDQFIRDVSRYGRVTIPTTAISATGRDCAGDIVTRLNATAIAEQRTGAFIRRDRSQTVPRLRTASRGARSRSQESPGESHH